LFKGGYFSANVACKGVLKLKFVKILFHRKNIKSLLWLLTIPILGIFYNVLNTAERGVRSLVTPVDQIIPFIEIFIIPYIIWYLYIVFAFCLLLVLYKRKYYEGIASYNIGLIICYLFYIFFQTTVQRPVLTEDNIFITLTKMIYNNDEPYNAFPSIHVYTTYLFMVLLWNVKMKRSLWITVQITGLLIILSTLFVKQHVILDVIASIIIVHIVSFVVRWISEKVTEIPSIKMHIIRKKVATNEVNRKKQSKMLMNE